MHFLHQDLMNIKLVTQDSQLLQLRRRILEAVMPIRNSARCHVLNPSTTKLRVNEALPLYIQFLR